MNAHEHRPLTAETAEQLLEGRPVTARHARLLADLLAMASAAAFPGELAGEDAAVAAFRAALSTDRTAQSGRRSMSKTALLAKLLTLKAAAIAVVAVSAGGVALAATTGVLPNPLAPQHPGHSTDAPGHPGNAATPSPSMVGLCTAFLAGAGADHGKALENPAFSALITAAGGKDKVDSFCAGIGVKPPGSGRGTGEPTSHPTGEPTSHPGDTQHPTGAPTTHPGH
jgi:hypothetical protein